MDKKLKEFLADILVQERNLQYVLSELNGVLSEAYIDSLYGNARSWAFVADFIGIPPDTTCNLSQHELANGKCEHGVQYYCRDWIMDEIFGDCFGDGKEELDDDFDKIEMLALVDTMIKHASEMKQIDFGPCHCMGHGKPQKQDAPNPSLN